VIVGSKNNPLLSICIPTYNRSKYLREAIESVLEQIDQSKVDKIELVISDNASTDETEAVVSRYIDRHQVRLKYSRNATNVGSDGNILCVVARSSGKYIWVLGDDDLVIDGAIDRLLAEIEANKNVDIYFGEKKDFLVTVDRPMRFRRIMQIDHSETFDFKKPEVMGRYFQQNDRLIAYCNFISNIIFNREKFNMIPDKERFLGTGYILPILSDYGYHDLAYEVASQTTYPSWGYMVEKGATSIWELWNSDTEPPDQMNSRNHFALGSVAEWEEATISY